MRPRHTVIALAVSSVVSTLALVGVRVRDEPGHRQAPALADERGAGDRHRPAAGCRGPQGDGRLQRSPDLQQYVSDIGLRLAKVSERPNLPWHFTVVDSPAINAFALPGGYIYITRGIMAFLQDEAQLAGVLGHEIGHVTARHAAEQYSRATGAQLGLVLGSIFVPAARGSRRPAAPGSACCS